jgi:hypothetical protein
LLAIGVFLVISLVSIGAAFFTAGSASGLSKALLAAVDKLR